MELLIMKTKKDIAMNTFNPKIEKCSRVVLLFLIATFCTTSSIFGQSMNMNATEGEYTDKVKITWEFTGFTTNPSSVEIKRDNQQIGFVNNNVILYYNDDEAIPGVIYEYQVIPRDANGTVMACSDDTDFGFIFPNGSISGTVSSPYGAGVEGVIVEAEGWVSDGNFTGLYNFFDTTDANGEYTIENIYYYDDADFTVSPHKSGHSFVPGSRERTLNTMGPTQANVNFTDTTVLTLSGKVMFAGTNCPVEDVDIYLDYNPTGVKTNSDGEYNISINDIGNHTVSVEYLHHNFTYTEQTVNVQDDVFDVDFYDSETDTLKVTLRGGCNNMIVDSARIKIYSNDPGNCYNELLYTDASSILYAVLPAQEYYVELDNVYPFNTNITNQFGTPLLIDLTQRDTVTEYVSDTTYVTTPADTTIYANGDTVITPEETTMYVEGDSAATAKMPEINFIYHSGTSIELSNMPDTLCVEGYNSVYYMEKNFTYPIVLQVSESYTYNEVLTSCYLDSAAINVYDDISGTGQDTVYVSDSYGIYIVEPQDINLAAGGEHPYQRMLQFDLGEQTVFVWAFIEGHKPRTQTFITKTPELPFFVLHDPPGDGSYSTITEGTSWTRTNSVSASFGGGGGVFWDVKAGCKNEFWKFKLDAYLQTKGEVFIGRDNDKNSTMTRTYEASETFSTSSSNLFIGHDADIYVGGSFNMMYALTDELIYDQDNCAIIRDTTLAWDMDSVKTTYMYTEEFIVNTLIPNLTTLKNLATGDSIEIYQNYIDVWEQVVENNNQARIDAFIPDTSYNYIYNQETFSIEIDTANPILTTESENISFSGGTSYTNSKTSGESETSSVSYTVYLNSEVSIALGFELAAGSPYLNSQGGVKFKFNWKTSKAINYSDSEKKTVSYHLIDDDTGDYFSVDVATDRNYGVPVFRTVAGTSSCPHEEGTQKRDTAAITLDHYAENNVDPNGQAVFTVNLVNYSESGETRGYYVGMNTGSNPDGAKVRLGGQYVTAGSIFYSLEPNMNHSVAMLVERGPIAYDYEDLQLRIYPYCFGLTEYLYAIGKWTVDFDVHFQHSCSSVDIFEPENNWLVNQSNENILQVVLNGYSSSNQYLESLLIEYRRSGQNWSTTAIIPKSDLTQGFYDYAWDVSNLDDGDYDIRAMAICDFDGEPAYTYSLISSGIIDRYSLELFGTPEPADGVLNISDDISVSFTEDIECQLVNTLPDVTLTRDDTGDDIPISFACYQNTMIIQTNPTSYIDSLEGVMLTAYVNNIQDLNYNMFTDGVQWSFIVNRSPVYWSPPNVETSVPEGETGLVEATLVNEAGVAKNYSISAYAGWLTPSTTSGTIVSGGTNQINFSVSNSLTAGMYHDTLEAIIDGKSSLLYITVYVLNPSPWEFVNTGTNHSIFIPYNAFEDIEINEGDYVGVFFDSLGTSKCGGYIDWNDESCAISAWGTEYDNFGNPIRNGFADDEAFSWQVWNVDNGYSFPIVPSYATINFPNQGNYATDGLSGILGFSVVDLQGCMDPFALNYNPNATTDDGSCQYDYEPVPWSYTNTGANHTIVIFADASRYKVNGTPIEQGDYIGAFYMRSDGTLACGGYREWENFTTNQAITVWAANSGNDGFANDEVFKWKIWDASEGIEVMGSAFYDTLNFNDDANFIIDGVSGLDSLITRPFQTIPLVGHPNWNLFSTYIDPDDPTVENIFAEIANDIHLVKNGAGQTYIPSYGVNLIGSIVIGEAYQVKLTTSDSVSLNILGDPVDAENTILSLPAAWSNLGYLHKIAQPVADMMSSIVNDIYIMKDGNGQAYIPQWSVNNIVDMKPGFGYQIKLLTAQTFTYPAASAAKSMLFFEEGSGNGLSQDVIVTGNNMTVIIPKKTWNTEPLKGDVIKVYNGNGMLVGSETYRGNNMSITIWGDDTYTEGVNGLLDNEEFFLKLFRSNDPENYDSQDAFFPEEKMIFVKSWQTGDKFFASNKISIVGDAQLSLTSDGQSSVILFQNVPNPFNNRTEICFYLPEDSEVQISLFNIVGVLQEQIVSKEYKKGKHTVVFDSKDFASGTYLYKFTAGTYTETKQLSIIK